MEIKEIPIISDEKIEYLTKVLKVIGHPLRLKILLAIYTKKCKVLGLVDCIQEPQPIISQQLAILRKSDIIIGNKLKNSVVYEISNKYALELIEDIIENRKESI